MHRTWRFACGMSAALLGVSLAHCSTHGASDTGGDAGGSGDDVGPGSSHGSGTASGRRDAGHADAAGSGTSARGDAASGTGSGDDTGTASGQGSGTGTGAGSGTGPGAGSGSGSGLIDVDAGAGTLSVRNSGYLPGSACDYGEYLPPGYTPTGNWPFMIFLHGVGQDGGTITSAVYSGGGPMYELNNGTITMAQIPMVVIQPHTDGYCEFSVDTDLPSFIEAAMTFYGLDPKRFYLSGLSEGGLGVNSYLDTFYTIAGAPTPAVGVPLAPAGEFKSTGTPQELINLNIPVWDGDSIYDSEFANPAYNNIGSSLTTDVFNLLTLAAGGTGFNLTTYPFPDPNGSTPYTCYWDTTSKTYVWVSGMVDSLAGSYITPPYLMTLWPGSEHSASWTPMYSNPSLYQWLLAHPRG